MASVIFLPESSSAKGKERLRSGEGPPGEHGLLQGRALNTGSEEKGVCLKVSLEGVRGEDGRGWRGTKGRGTVAEGPGQAGQVIR